MADFEARFDWGDLKAKLESLQGEDQKKIMASAFRAGAEVFQAAVEEAAPIRTEDAPGGNALPPGALKSDVVISASRSGPLPAYNVKFGKYTAHVARFMDEGFRIVRRLASTKKKRGKAVPGELKQTGFKEGSMFFRSAFEAASPEASKVIEEKLAAGINKLWKG